MEQLPANLSIDGERASHESGATPDHSDIANGGLVGAAARGNPEDVQRTLEAAGAAAECLVTAVQQVKFSCLLVTRAVLVPMQKDRPQRVLWYERCRTLF